MRKLLYVEDNEDNLYMLRLRFDVLGGYEVLSARDGAAGIAMAASERPDLILMDLNLPGIDGWEATRRLRDTRHSDHPLSAYAMTGDREKALATGCDDFDAKPVAFDRLRAKIDQVLAPRSDRVSLKVVNLEGEVRAPDLWAATISLSMSSWARSPSGVLGRGPSPSAASAASCAGASVSGWRRIAGVPLPAQRRPVCRAQRWRGAQGRIGRSRRPDGQPQCRLRHARADR